MNKIVDYKRDKKRAMKGIIASVLLLMAGLIGCLTGLFFYLDSTAEATKAQHRETMFDPWADSSKGSQNSWKTMEIIGLTDEFASDFKETYHYYFAFDPDWYLFIVKMKGDLGEEFQPCVDYVYEDGAQEPEPVKVRGVAVPIEEDIREYAIECLNLLYDEEFMTDEEFDDYMGVSLLDLSQKPVGRAKFDTAGGFAIFGVIASVLGIIFLSANILNRKGMVEAEQKEKENMRRIAAWQNSGEDDRYRWADGNAGGTGPAGSGYGNTVEGQGMGGFPGGTGQAAGGFPSRADQGTGGFQGNSWQDSGNTQSGTGQGSDGFQSSAWQSTGGVQGSDNAWQGTGGVQRNADAWQSSGDTQSGTGQSAGNFQSGTWQNSGAGQGGTWQNNPGAMGSGSNVSGFGQAGSTAYNSAYNMNGVRLTPVKKSNVFLGIIGAIGGSLLGVALWVGLSLIGFIAGIAGFAMLKFALVGYEKLSGKMDKKGAVICLIIAAFMVFFANVIDYMVTLCQAFFRWDASLDTVWYVIMNFPTLMTDADCWGGFILNLIIGYGLSIWASFRLIGMILKYKEN